MTISPGFTADEIAGYVREYLRVPHGSKRLWLRDQPFTEGQMARWRRTYLAGDLHLGLVPRGSGDGDFLERAMAAEEELERVRADLLAQIARQEAQIRLLEEGTVTLGKAFGLLQKMSSQEPENE